VGPGGECEAEILSEKDPGLTVQTLMAMVLKVHYPFIRE
jgi:hypothetical protein